MTERVRLALDCFEEVRQANRTNDYPHFIEYIEVINSMDSPHFAELEVTASVQPLHFAIASKEGRYETITILLYDQNFTG